ncbi:kinesin-like protein Nod isoform X2 [Drosophila innubila]|uniref:kinesin-like protein Nod isoform X2 n=1 Tax=Drosophila innubila TaxID=198719 RepID=UPI00148C9EA3|nr:kinesin-like protein Nod isoform X2 [Drosophila innubila]
MKYKDNTDRIHKAFKANGRLYKPTKQSLVNRKVRFAERSSHNATQKKSTNATQEKIRRVLPSSTAIKRPLVLRSHGSVSNSLCTPDKHSVGTNTLQRYNSDIGLTPKAKECARILLNLPVEPKAILNPEYKQKVATTCLSPVPEQDNCSLRLAEMETHFNTPTVYDYMELKIKYNALKQRTLEQGKQKQEIETDVEHEPQELHQSLLSYSQFNSELCSIAEENDQASAVCCKLFSSISSSSVRGTTPVDVSGICALPSLSTPLDEDKQISPTSRRSSKRLTCRQLNVQMQPKLRRSIRIASQAEPSELPSEPLVKRKNGSNTTNTISKLSLSASQPARLSKHRATLLELLNNGGVKELQALPYIGPKTALMLVMQRSLFGQFKNWRQVQELPIWKGNSWLRFANANCILPYAK